ncbi:MAG: hypothetical protein ACRDSP_25805 [Pseudonocardiaceae bacterium]
MTHQEAPTTVPSTNGDLRTLPVSCFGDDGSPSASAGSGSEHPTTDREPNAAGRATAITMLNQLQGWGAPYLRLALWALRHLHPLTPARNLSFIHFAHFSVFDKLGPAAKDGPQGPYLLFESNFNGLWEEYIEAFCQVIGMDINVLMASCEGFPGLIPARGFRTFMENHEFVAQHYYSAYPEASATMIRAAEELAGDLKRLSTLAAGRDDSAFSRAWYRLLALPRVQTNLAGQACTLPGLSAYLRRLLFAKKNVAGNAYAFVALTPIKRGHVDELRTHLQRLPRLDQSPLAGVPGTHFGRWVVVDRVFHDSWPEQFELLDPAYLLFTAVFDRTSRDPVAGYLDTLLSALGTEADAIWGACEGWPDPGDRNSYLREHQRDAQFLFAGYPGEVAEVRRALADREMLVDFARRAQTLPPDQLRAAFAAETDRSATQGS